MEPLNSHEKQWIPVHICSNVASYTEVDFRVSMISHICFITPSGTFNNCGVSKDEVSNWLGLIFFPKPNKGYHKELLFFYAWKYITITYSSFHSKEDEEHLVRSWDIYLFYDCAPEDEIVFEDKQAHELFHGCPEKHFNHVQSLGAINFFILYQI